MTGEVKKAGIGKSLGKVVLIVLGVLVGLIVLGAIVGGEDTGGSAPVAAANNVQGQAGPAASAEPESASMLTGPQANAARTAQQYLDMTGFSRAGLIDQLSSDAGNGYERADAAVAVDSLGVDWNEQAVRSAKSYMEMTGFSCKGLIQQLSSSAGSKYTKEEASHGAQQSGAC